MTANDGEALAALAAWAESFEGELEHRPVIVSEGAGRGARVHRVAATIWPVLLWLPADLTAFREGIADILRTVQRCLENFGREQGNRASTMEQLSPGDCERIRFAIKNRHDLGTVPDLLWGTKMAKVLGHQFLDQLAAADQKLKPDEVSELVTLALAGIPERP